MGRWERLLQLPSNLIKQAGFVMMVLPTGVDNFIYCDIRAIAAELEQGANINTTETTP